MIIGNKEDVSYIMDWFEPYVFLMGERTVDSWGAVGRSLGGHTTWHVLSGADASCRDAHTQTNRALWSVAR